MYLVVERALPLIGLIALGFLLKQIGLIGRNDRYALMQVIFAATLPATVFVSLSRANVGPWNLLILAGCAVTIPLVTHLIARQAARVMGLRRETAAVMVLSTLISAVMLYLAPVFSAFYGSEGLSRVAAYDLGNALVASSYSYYLATRYAEVRASSWRVACKRILTVPQFWAAVLALAVNLTGVSVPTPIMQLLEPLGAANGPLGMLALGCFIELRLPAWRPVLATVGLRMGLSWVIGQLLVLATGLTGLDRTVVSLAAATPIGIVPLTYASKFGLDTEFAAATLSLSIVMGIVSTPILLWVYGLT